MSISSRINEMSSHIEQAYDELQGLGADLTNVNKNIENISMVLDDIYDSMPQVSGEGTSLTLDDTRVGKIKSTLKGNTTQDGTPTPSSPIPVNVVSGDNEINVAGKNLYNDNFNDYTRPVNYFIFPIALMQGQQYTIKATLKGTSMTGVVAAIVPYGNQYVDFSTTLKMVVDSQGYVRTITFTPDDTWTSPKLAIYASDEATFNSLFKNYEIQLEKGSTATTYEPYQGTNYQVNLPIENILDITSSGSSIGGVPFTIENGIIKINGTTSSSIASYYFNTFRTKSESAMFSIEVTGYTDKSSGNSALILQQSDDGTTGWSTLSELSLNSVYAKQNSVTLDSSKYYRLRWYVDNNTFTNAKIKAQLEYGNKKNSFTPYGTTPIELCKIGNYQDYFYKDSGKWYLHKEIGKVVLDGSENWTTRNGRTSYAYMLQDVFDKYKTTGLCNYFRFIEGGASDSQTTECIASANTNRTASIFTNNSSLNTLANFKTWLSTHNTIVYYVLATPVNTALEDM